jgi:hypothetical protein
MMNRGSAPYQSAATYMDTGTLSTLSTRLADGDGVYMRGEGREMEREEREGFSMRQERCNGKNGSRDQLAGHAPGHQSPRGSWAASESACERSARSRRIFHFAVFAFVCYTIYSICSTYVISVLVVLADCSALSNDLHCIIRPIDNVSISLRT